MLTRNALRNILLFMAILLFFCVKSDIKSLQMPEVYKYNIFCLNEIKVLKPNDIVIAQDIIVTDGDKVLTDGVDYYVSEKYIDHSGNITSGDSDDANTLEITVKGIGNYTGTVKNIRQIVIPDNNGYIDNIDTSGLGNDSNAYNGITHYIEPDGRTSVEVWGNGIIWLKEESDGTYAWYGLDNTSGAFKKGSRFWVKWIECHPDIDPEHLNMAEDKKIWIFLTGVTAPDGTEYTNLDTDIPYYIQLGQDWDREDVRAAFINKNVDETIEVNFADNFKFPGGIDTFAKLMLRHFSPYAIYDSYDSYDNPSSMNYSYSTSNYSIPTSFNKSNNSTSKSAL